MKNFLLSTVILFIMAGFFHAYSTLGKDALATNPKHNLASVKNGLTSDLPSKAVSNVNESVSSTIEKTESPVGLSQETLSGSLVHKLLFNEDQVKPETERQNIPSVVLDSTDSVKKLEINEDIAETEHEKEIIRIYKETPQIFNLEALREYLSAKGYEEEYIENVCREILAE